MFLVRKTIGNEKKRPKFGVIIVINLDIPEKHVGKFMRSLLT